MKKIITALLVAAVLHITSPQIERPAKAQSLPLFVLGCVIVGAIITIYVTKHGQTPAFHTFVLEKGHFDGNWTPVATNTLKMTLDQAWKAFEVDIDKDSSVTTQYRIQVYPPQLQLAGGYAISSSLHERAIPQEQ